MFSFLVRIWCMHITISFLFFFPISFPFSFSHPPPISCSSSFSFLFLSFHAYSIRRPEVCLIATKMNARRNSGWQIPVSPVLFNKQDSSPASSPLVAVMSVSNQLHGNYPNKKNTMCHFSVSQLKSLGTSLRAKTSSHTGSRVRPDCHGPTGNIRN